MSEIVESGLTTPASPSPAAKQVKVRDLRAHLASYLEEVAAGASIEVVSRGQIVAELRPPSKSRQDRASTRGILKGQFWFAPDWHAPSEELADLFENSTL